MFGHKEPGLLRAFLSKTLIVDGEVVGTTPTRSVARPTGLRPLASIWFARDVLLLGIPKAQPYLQPRLAELDNVLVLPGPCSHIS